MCEKVLRDKDGKIGRSLIRKGFIYLSEACLIFMPMVIRPNAGFSIVGVTS